MALQTALAKVNGGTTKESRVRVLFDSGSHCSFVTARAVGKSGLRPVRREKLEIKVFGSDEAEVQEREVVNLSLESVQGRKSLHISCFVVNDISEIANVHPEKVKQGYPYLRQIFFSDVSRFEYNLQVDILVGLDYQWQFMEGEIIRGGRYDPVAVRTTLGWVLSGPVKGKKLNSTSISVNFIHISEQEKNGIDSQVNRLWDLDTLGIRPEEDIQENLLDNMLLQVNDIVSHCLGMQATDLFL